MEDKKSLGIYIHIPFCKSRCIYCDFVSSLGDESARQKYCSYLQKEICLAAQKYSKEYTVDTLYFGGGTPSLLSEKNFCDIVKCVKDNFDCRLKEFSVEVNPCTANMQKFDAFTKCGVTRISIGVQSFNDNLLKMLGRAHDCACAKQAVKLAKSYGFEVSVDCMTGLPGQSVEDIKDFIDVSEGLNVDHISVYMLSVEEGTRLQKLIEEGVLVAKTDDEVADLYDVACKALREKDFQRYEISNFCKNGKVSLHNMRYWLRKDYLGLGLAAHSLIMNTRWQNPHTFEEYYKSLDGGKLPQNDIINLDTCEQEEEYIMLALRLKEGIDIKKYNEIFGSDFKKEYRYALLKDAKYLDISDERVAIKDEYLSVMNSLIVDFLK